MLFQKSFNFEDKIDCNVQNLIESYRVAIKSHSPCKDTRRFGSKHILLGRCTNKYKAFMRSYLPPLVSLNDPTSDIRAKLSQRTNS